MYRYILQAASFEENSLSLQRNLQLERCYTLSSEALGQDMLLRHQDLFNDDFVELAGRFLSLRLYCRELLPF